MDANRDIHVRGYDVVGYGRSIEQTHTQWSPYI